MRVFISWSGEQSHTAAVALGKFLAKPWSTNVKTFVSSVDIEAGAQWQADILEELDASNFGVICVTRENQAKPWVNFEAGAIAKNMAESRCVPLAVDLKPAEIARPLGMYQAKAADQAGVWALVESINAALGEDERPDKDDLLALFEAFWPELKEALDSAAVPPASAPGPAEDPAAVERKMVEEILTTVRGLAQRMPSEPPPASDSRRRGEPDPRTGGSSPTILRMVVSKRLHSLGYPKDIGVTLRTKQAEILVITDQPMPEEHRALVAEEVARRAPDWTARFGIWDRPEE